MRPGPIGRGMLAAVVAAGLLAVGPPDSAASDGEYFLRWSVESSSAPLTELKMWFGEDWVRFDPGGQGADVSVVWIGGDEPRVLMIMRSQGSYMEWTQAQMERMSQMMSRMPGGMEGGEESEEETDWEEVTFEITGNTKSVGPGWQAQEVIARGEGMEGTLLYFSTEVDIGIVEIGRRMMKIFDSMPMIRQMQQQNPTTQAGMQRLQALVAAGDLPEGQVVQVISEQGGDSVTMTLQEVGEGPFGDDIREPIEGLEKMEMPQFRP